MREVLILSSIQWDFLWQRHQTFATLFHEHGWKTVFVESTGIANPSFKDLGRILLRRYGGLKKLRNPRPEGLTIINPLVLPPTYRIFKRINEIFFIPRLVKKILATGLENPIIIAYPPTHTTLELINSLPSKLVVYDCVDNFEAFPRAWKDIPLWEEKLAQRAEIITASSPFLYEKFHSNFPEKTFPLYHGVNYELFSKIAGGRVEKVKKVCFYGAVGWVFDFHLVWGTASVLNQIQFHLVGPIKASYPKPPDNVLFHSPLSPPSLIEFLKGCDLFLIPYVRNAWGQGVFPTKFFEILATGKPLAISGIEENVKDYLHLVYTVKNAEELVRTIKQIPATESEELVKERMRIAKENSWQQRFNRLVELIDSRLAGE